MARRLAATIPGLCPLASTAFAASVANPAQFRSGREFTTWLELTPSQKPGGGKDRLRRITARPVAAVTSKPRKKAKNCFGWSVRASGSRYSCLVSYLCVIASCIRLAMKDGILRLSLRRSSL